MTGGQNWLNMINQAKITFYFRMVVFAVCIFVFIATSLLTIFNFYYADRFFPNTHVRGINISNMTLAEALRSFPMVERTSDTSLFTLKTNKIQKAVGYDAIKFTFEHKDTLLKIFAEQRNHKFIDQVLVNATSFVKSSRYELLYTYDKNALNLLVTQIKFEGTDHYQEPTFAIKSNKVYLIPGKAGDNFDDEELKSEIISRFITSDATDLSVNVQKKDPSVSGDIANTLIPSVQKIVDKKMTIKFYDYVWDINAVEMVTMLTPDVDGMGQGIIRINNDKLIEKIQNIALEVDRNPSAQVLKVEDDKVVEFGAPKDGLSTDINATAEKLAIALLDEAKSVDLIVNITASPESDANEFGIKEVLGVGKSKFAGSIKSRIHNVGLASSRVSGILVAPGETFSFVKAVGEITRKTGYQSAYVISGGRTVLGDGGGVCQVSTTLFRAALEAGLQIVERNPHSYRVGYYEQDSPPGIDAAVYSPSVDLKFVNNTPKHILIVSELDAARYSLKYTVYGTSDDRKVTMSKPRVLSRTAPRSPIYEVNPSLPKGAKKLMEGSVWGASVVFDREVVNASGESILKDTFKSNYRAWPAVYQIGPE